MTTETVTGPFLLVFTAEQIPLLNDCIYEGVTHADHEDLEAMVMFRSALQTQLDEGTETAEAVRHLLADHKLVQTEVRQALRDTTPDDLARIDALLGATP